MKAKIVICFILSCIAFSVGAQESDLSLEQFPGKKKHELAILKQIANDLTNDFADAQAIQWSGVENPRLVAIGLTLLLGPFGAHRIYLGTREGVPIFYTLTLGGGLGVIPVIDLLHLIFAKDISRFINNDKVIMW